MINAAPNSTFVAIALALLGAASPGLASEPGSPGTIPAIETCSAKSIGTLSAPLRKSMQRLVQQLRVLGPLLQRLRLDAPVDADYRMDFFGAVRGFSRAHRAFQIDSNLFAGRAAACAVAATIQSSSAKVDSAATALRELYSAMTRRESALPDSGPLERLVAESMASLRDAEATLLGGPVSDVVKPTAAFMPQETT